MEANEVVELSPLATNSVLEECQRRGGDPLLFGVPLERVPQVAFGDAERVPQLVADCIDWLRANDASASEVNACNIAFRRVASCSIYF